jgi:hypothetical protein
MFNFLKNKAMKENDTNDEDYSQAVIISFDLSSEFGTEQEHTKAYELEDLLVNAIEETGIGIVDGHEFGDSEWIIYVYGKDAKNVYQHIEKFLKESSFKPVRSIIREGSAEDPDAKKTKMVLQ